MSTAVCSGAWSPCWTHNAANCWSARSTARIRNRARRSVTRPGEGIVGRILESGELIVLRRIADDPRFLDRLQLYDRELPFIGVPICVGRRGPTGVLDRPARARHDDLLYERAHFLEMVANLIARSVRLAWEVERERQDADARNGTACAGRCGSATASTLSSAIAGRCSGSSSRCGRWPNGTPRC